MFCTSRIRDGMPSLTPIQFSAINNTPSYFHHSVYAICLFLLLVSFPRPSYESSPLLRSGLHVKRVWTIILVVHSLDALATSFILHTHNEFIISWLLLSSRRVRSLSFVSTTLYPFVHTLLPRNNNEEAITLYNFTFASFRTLFQRALLVAP